MTHNIYRYILLIVAIFFVHPLLAQIQTTSSHYLLEELSPIFRFSPDGNYTPNAALFPGPIDLIAGNEIIQQGANACVDITVGNFNNITTLQFSMTWSTNVVDYTGVSNFGLAGLTASNINVPMGGGFLEFSWMSASASGESLADGTVLFTICFDGIGDPDNAAQNNTALSFVSIPTPVFVTDADSGTTDIQANTNSGSITIAPPPPVLTITDAIISEENCFGLGAIDLVVAGGEAPYIFSWDNGTMTEDLIEVAAGDYTVRILDSATPPMEIVMTYTVEADTLSPSVNAGTDAMIDCSMPSISLDGTGTSEGIEYSYLWTTDEGNITADEGTLNPQVDAIGIYTLEVVNAINGCSATDQVMITGDLSAPSADAGMDQELGCGTDPIFLDGSTSSQGDNFSYNWTTSDGSIVAGGTTLMPEIGGTGTYDLVVTNSENQCTALASVMVSPNMNAPQVNAGEDVAIDCAGSAINLNGTASDNGANFSYEWTTINGFILSGATSLTPEVDQLGSYVLTITNAENECSATDTVAVILSDGLVAAEAGEDFSICEDASMIEGNLPSGTTGAWTSDFVANVLNPDENSSTVEQLVSGDNPFIWTLSTADCPSYSSDTIIIQKAGTPQANNDQVIREIGEQILSIDVTFNDDLNNVEEWEVTFLVPDEGGFQDLGNGVFEYPISASFAGSFQIDYSICNMLCPILCDTASVSIVIEDLNNPRQFTFPNGITPNGDGVNDTLVFDDVEVETIENTDSELIVFSRWGGVVYQSKPYLNDWNGVNQSGKPLPAGTYYFIYRQNLAQGIVYKGDITILR